MAIILVNLQGFQSLGPYWRSLAQDPYCICLGRHSRHEIIRISRSALTVGALAKKHALSAQRSEFLRS